MGKSFECFPIHDAGGTFACPKDKELAIMDALKAFRMLTEDTEYMEVAI